VTVEGVDFDAITGPEPDILHLAFVGMRRRKALRIARWKIDKLMFKSPEANETKKESRRD
jgi:hypothetical protein